MVRHVGRVSRAEGARDSLRESWNCSLRKMIRLCAEAHPYYREIFANLGLTPSDFQTVEDLRKLPLTLREQYVADPESFRLDTERLGGLSLEERTIADIIYTSGTTGRPTPFYDTVHDRFARIEHIGRGAEIAGVRESDVVANLFPLSSAPHQGFLSATWGAQALGARLISGLTGRSYGDFDVHRRLDEAVRLVERQGATILWGITSFVRRFICRAQELGCDLSGVRMAMAMGEPCPPGMREDMRARLEAVGASRPSISNGYGFTEIQAPAMECAELGPRHAAAPAQFFFETLDLSSGEPTRPGEPGMLAVTHMNRRGTVLLRYRVGDVVAMEDGECPQCGRVGPRFVSDPYRADRLVKLKGTLVDPEALHRDLSPLLGIDGVIEYQLAVGPSRREIDYSADVLTVRVACKPEAQRAASDCLKVLSASALEVTPGVEFLPENAFESASGEYKFRRFVDNRQPAG